ncbi:hypothetical protein U1Q18_052581 [Sarracenia purpurea var. burkii]
MPKSFHLMHTRSKSGMVKPNKFYNFSASISPTVEPHSFPEAMKFVEWRKVMSEEFDALIAHGTWHLVPPLSSANVIGCKWIYKIKQHSDGTIARYKARLVAQGNQQTEGLDYLETF